jgi:hypothetical protein
MEAIDGLPENIPETHIRISLPDHNSLPECCVFFLFVLECD